MSLFCSQLEITLLDISSPSFHSSDAKAASPAAFASFSGSLVPESWQLFQQSPGDLLVLGRLQKGFEVQEGYGGAAKRAGCLPGGNGKVIRLPEERGAFAVSGYDADRVQALDQNEQGLLVKVAGHDECARVMPVPQSR